MEATPGATSWALSWFFSGSRTSRTAPEDGPRRAYLGDGGLDFVMVFPVILGLPGLRADQLSLPCGLWLNILGSWSGRPRTA